MASKLSKEQMYEIIADKTEQLPSLPNIVYELLGLVNDPMTNLSQIEAIISKDPSLATQVLKVANSAFYGIPGGASNLNKAITYLGMERLYQVAITATIFENLESESNEFFDIKEFWKHSFVTATTAEQMALEFNYEDRPTAFLSGLVHDIGKIVFHNFNQDSFSQICEYAQKNDLTIAQAEAALNSLTHSEVGYLVARKWNFPEPVLSCIHHHHDYELNLSAKLSADEIKLVDIVSLANILTHTLNIGHSGYNVRVDVPLEIIDRLDISRKRWVDFLMNLRDHLQSADTVIEHFIN